MTPDLRIYRVVVRLAICSKVPKGRKLGECLPRETALVGSRGEEMSPLQVPLAV